MYQNSNQKEGHYGKTRRANWRLDRVILGRDNFAADLPGFNIKGEESVPTIIGGVLSIIILLFVFQYGATKSLELHLKEDPNIVETQVADYYESTDAMTFNSMRQRFAFAYVNYDDKKMRNSTEYVKILARNYRMSNGVSS